MSVLLQEVQLGDLILAEASNRLSREVVIVSGGMDLGIGSVLGRISATEKYILSAPDASDGSQIPAAVLAVSARAAASDVKAVALVGRAKVLAALLRFHSSIDSPEKRGAALAALARLGFVFVPPLPVGELEESSGGTLRPIVIGGVAYAPTWTIGPTGQVLSYPPEPDPAFVVGAIAHSPGWSLSGGVISAHPSVPSEVPDVSDAGVIHGVSNA